MEVNVQREVAPEPLHGGDASGAWVGDAERAAPVAIPALDHASRDAVHREREVVVVGERHAQLERQAQDPLSYAHARQHRAHPVACHLRHASSQAARAKPSPFAREPHQAVLPTVPAREAYGPEREHPTLQVVTQLIHHEGGHRLVGLGASSEEGLQVLTHEPMQARRLRVVRRVVLVVVGRARCGARGHGAPASNRRYGPEERELQGKRASTGEVAAAGGGLRQRAGGRAAEREPAAHVSAPPSGGCRSRAPRREPSDGPRARALVYARLACNLRRNRASSGRRPL